MAGLVWGPEQQSRLDAIRDDLAQVSTASACPVAHAAGVAQHLHAGALAAEPLGLGKRLVGRARTCRYLMRRGPEGAARTRPARRTSAEISLIESIEPGDFFCVDALGVPTAGIIGDILATRLKYRGTSPAIINGAVRDTPYLKGVGLPVFTGARASLRKRPGCRRGRLRRAINMAGVYLIPGDIILADDEGVLAMPLDLAEYVAAHGPAKERQEMWIRGKVEAGGSVHDYYPPNDEKAGEYERETGQTYHR